MATIFFDSILFLLYRSSADRVDNEALQQRLAFIQFSIQKPHEVRAIT